LRPKYSIEIASRSVALPSDRGHEALAEIASSASVDNNESVRLPAEAGTYYIEVMPYGGAENTYSITID